jgi:Mycothiol maleylpyruvate isomerase N-terminal domain
VRQLSFPHDDAVTCLVEQVSEFVAAADSLDDMQLLGSSRCHGWSALDVVVHVQLGLQEMAIGTTSRTSEAPNRDAASYWDEQPDDRDEDPVPHILWLRRAASAYGRPTHAVTHLKAVADTVIRAVQAMPQSCVEFQGKRMLSGDFLATWVVELVVHQLDLGLDQTPVGIGWTRRTLEAIADADLPAGLDDRSATLVGLGRVPSPPSVRLGPPFPISL